MKVWEEGVKWLQIGVYDLYVGYGRNYLYVKWKRTGGRFRQQYDDWKMKKDIQT